MTGDFDYDHIDRAVLSRLERVVEDRAPHLARTLQSLLRSGASFSDMLALYVSEKRRCLPDDDIRYVPLEDLPSEHRAAHTLIATCMFNRRSKTYSGLDATGALFSEPARLFYPAQRLGGVWYRHAHPAVVEYVERLLREPTPPEPTTTSSPHRGGDGSIADDCIIGRGKQGSYVFVPKLKCFLHAMRASYDAADAEADGEPSEERPISDHVRFCRFDYDDDGMNMGATVQQQRHCGKFPKLKDALLKVNSDPIDTLDELNANAKVHAWLSKAHLIAYSSLHDSTSHIKVYKSTARGPSLATLLVLRRFRGDVKRAILQMPDMVRLIRSVLVVLDVIHDHGHLHQDIKPMNILYASDMRFAVADFGLVDKMTHVQSDLKRHVYSGTPGFMSPVLQPDSATGSEDARNVLDAFQSIAYLSRRVHVTDDELTRMFARAADSIRSAPPEMDKLRPLMAKVDLHSVALTIYNLLGREQQDGIGKQDRLRLVRYMDRLMFYESGCFTTAQEALRALDRDDF